MVCLKTFFLNFRYLCLPIPECVCLVNYIWIDGTGVGLRSKSRTLDYIPDSHKEVPLWTFDGSLTQQPSTCKNQTARLIPVALYNDPFRRGNNKLCLCEAYTLDSNPMPTNFRAKFVQACNQVCDYEPMWGFDQEYQLMDVDGRPFGWPVMHGEPKRESNYCAFGADKAYGREVTEAHYRACLYAGVKLRGCHADVKLSQWEFQIGICKGIKGADDLWMARFILGLVAEDYGVCLSFDPKPFPHLKGSACHVNFSTKSMRADDGLSKIQEAITKLCNSHKDHLKEYDSVNGEDNKRRLTGVDESSNVDTFSHGIGETNFSVRITSKVADEKKGYLEDRRPGANCDPYRVCYMILKSCLL